MIPKLLSSLVFVFVLTFSSCSSNQNQVKSAKFDEEFFTGETIFEYNRFEFNTFSNSVFMDIVGDDEENQKRNFLYNSVSLFTYPDIKKSCRILEYRYRDYYSAFYSVDNQNRENVKKTSSQYCGMYGYKYDLATKDDIYSKHVKFNNYNSLSKVKLTYQNFYLYNIIHLIDVFDGENKIATTFEFVYYAVNNGKITFYDNPNCYTRNYDCYHNNNKFFAYYDEEMFKNSTIIPYFYQPYQKSCLMASRVEIDNSYVYFHKLLDKQLNALKKDENGEPRNITYQVLTKTHDIFDYDIEQKKSVKKEVSDTFYRIPLEELF